MVQQKKEILIVEDNQMNASLVAAVLEERGYCVFTAADGNEGLEKLETNSGIKGGSAIFSCRIKRELDFSVW